MSGSGIPKGWWEENPAHIIMFFSNREFFGGIKGMDL